MEAGLLQDELGSWGTWGVPSILLLAWLLLARTVLARVFRWFKDKTDEEQRLDEKLIVRLHTAAFAAALVAGFYVWVWFAPMPDQVQTFLRDRVQPWFWYTLLLLVWIIAGLYMTRRLVKALASRADRTQADVDDALTSAIRRPLLLVVILVGVNIWAALVPLQDNIWSLLEVVNKVVSVIAVASFLDTFAQVYITLRGKHSQMFATSGQVLGTASRLIIYTLALLMLISSVGVNVTPLLASLGVGSLALGLALQKSLEDFLAGLLIAADQPIRVGDFIEVGGSEGGTVVSIGWRTTRIRTRADVVVIVPNSRLSTSTVINRSMPQKEVSFQVGVGVAYGSDLPRVATVTHAVAQSVQIEDVGAVTSFEPRILFEKFNDSSVDLTVWLRARSWEEHFAVKDGFVQRLHARYGAEGIEIPFPIRTLNVPREIPVATVDLTGGGAS
ncbi:MAG: mechanosensitive ion channel family protein [Myxococcota bacterium]|nr:mechanosensitive ion channel family protein [Myxococcota bacterium]